MHILLQVVTDSWQKSCGELCFQRMLTNHSLQSSSLAYVLYNGEARIYGVGGKCTRNNIKI